MSIKFLPLKRAVCTALLVLLMSAVGLTNAMAQSFTVGNLNYSVNSDGVSVTLTGHVDGTSATGPLVIPESVTYNGTAYTVKEISHIAFRHNTGLTGDLVIPNSVTTIRSSAFEGCSGFTGVLTIGTSLTTAEDYAFNGCSGLTEVHYNAINCEDSYSVLSYCDGLHTLVIGDNVERIPGGWFSGRAFTGSLTIPNSVTSIGESAFQGCSGFTGSLTIPNSVTSIGQYAFSGCSGFTGSLTIGNSVTIINAYAFSGCRGFTGILTIPNSVTKIYNRAFQNCTGFTGSLVIPNSVTWLSGFNGCTGFTGSLVIPNSVDTIGGYAFQGCTGFTGSLTLGNSVNRIGLYAFQDCTGFLGVLNIPNSVTSIGQHAFEGCSGFMGSLTIPNSVTIIEEEAFSYCRGFTGSLTIGNSVTTIGSSAFNYCSFTGSLTIGNSVTTIGGSAFSSCYDFTGSLTIPNSVTTIGQYAFSGCSGFTGSLTIGNSVTTIGGAAFEGCSGFTGSLTIPNSVTTIGGSAFSGCGGFTGSLVIPNTVLTIDEYAFSGCSGITGNLTIPNSITTIKKGTFSGCSGFTGNLVIPNSVVTIGQNGDVSYEQDGAFYNCSGFTGLTIPNSVMVIGGAAFYGCSGFTGSLTIPNSVTTIGSAAFYGCSGFTGSLTIPNSVTTIGSYAFSGCSGFTGDLVIPNSVFTIKNYAFNNCSGLTSLTIGSSVVTIEEGAFAYCSGFTGALVIPNSVISIGRTNNYVSGAFQNCSGFTSLVLGESLMTIAGNDFRNCTGFTEIYSNNATPPMIIMNNTFSNFSVPVYVPCGSETDYQAATGWNNFTEIMGLCAGTVTVEANPADGGTVAGGGYYESGTQCTVTAVANEGFAFANWTKNGVVASTNATYTFPVAGDMTLVANFLQDGNIVFADANVKAICVEHWDTNGDGELSYVEAAVVTSLEYYFRYNEEITSFDELQYFIGLNSIGNETFAYCSGLTSIVLPSSLTTIGGWAFFECSGLTTIALPNTLLSIGYAAFYACNGLTSIVLPSSLANIGEQAFLSCDNIQSITSWGVTPPIISYNTFSGLYDKQLIVPCDAIEVYQNADYWSDFTNIVGMCGGTVTVEANPAEGGTVAGGGYYESGTLCTVTAVANEGFAFANWTKNGMVASTNATYTFPVAGDMTLVANFLQDGNIVFADANVKAICVEHWDTNGDGELSYVEAASVSSLEYYFEYNEAITSFDELQYFIGLNSIGNYAFYYCSGLTSIVLPSSITNIGNSAFYYCSSLTSIVLPSSMTTIGNNAFRYCSDLQSIISLATTPPVISSYYTFSGYGLLLFVPCGTLEAYQNANYWSNFTNILPGTSNYIIQDGLRYEITSSNPPQAKLMGFAEGTTAAENLVIPAAINSECPELNYAVTAIADSAFYNCNSLTGTLTLPESMTTIGNRTFFNSGLTGDLVIPENIVIIGPQTFAYCGFSSLHFNATDCVSIGLNDEGTWNFAFWNCTQLEEIVIGNNVTQIPIYAFANTNAQNCRVDLGTGVATINNYAFYNGTSNPTYSIKGALVIPASVGTIGYCAFYGCSGLTEIWSKRPSAPYIQFNTFTDVDNSIPVHVPCGSTSSYQYSNYWSAFTNYVENPAVLIARSNNELLGMATVTKYGDCSDNVSIVQAMPYMGAFASWTTPDGTVVSTNATYTFALTQDTILTANFEPMPNVNAFVGGGSTNHWDDPNNWLTNELPTAISTVSILADVEVNVDACVQGLTVYGNNVVTIAPDAQLTVAGTLGSSSASSIVVEDGGQLVHTNDGLLATVKRIVTPYTVGEHDGWHLIANPLSYNAYIYDIENLTGNEYDLYYYDEPSVYWINQEDGNNYYEEMEVGKGYLYGNNQNVTLSFSGYLQNGSATVNVPLSYTTGHALQGFNLVGNPFAHNVTSYASVNVANGCYVMNEAKDDLIVSEISEENPLKPAEGFFVKATAAGASITFNPGRGLTATQSGTIRVELVENDKLIDRLLVKTAEGQPLEKFSLNERRTRLFAQGERQELAIVPCEGNEQAVNFKAAKNGQYTISVNADGMDFSYLHLIDNLTGADVDLLAEPSYTFDAKTSDYASRFKLVFSACGDADGGNETFAFISNGNIVITDADANATLQIVDVTGRVVVSSDAARNVSTSGMSAGVYVLRLINGNDVRTQKIVVE